MLGGQPRNGDGRFAEWKGTNPEVTLDDASSVQGMLDADSSLPETFRYEAVGERGSLVVLMFVSPDLDRGEYIDMGRSRIGKRVYQPVVTAAMTRIREMPGVVAVNIAVDSAASVDDPKPPVRATAVGPLYARGKRQVVDMTLVGPEGEFTAPVPAERRDEPVTWLAQTGQYPVLERIVGSKETERLLREHAMDSIPESRPADTLF